MCLFSYEIIQIEVKLYVQCSYRNSNILKFYCITPFLLPYPILFLIPFRLSIIPLLSSFTFLSCFSYFSSILEYHENSLYLRFVVKQYPEVYLICLCSISLPRVANSGGFHVFCEHAPIRVRSEGNRAFVLYV